MSEALDPANTIICRIGGRERVQEITGATRTRVYRWTQPKEKGGTGGIIPNAHAVRLLSYAREHDIPVSAEDFFGGVNDA